MIMMRIRIDQVSGAIITFMRRRGDLFAPHAAAHSAAAIVHYLE